MDLKNIYVVGDVHGCYHTLNVLIASLPQYAELIFVGDLCDKGNFTKEVIELVIQKGWRSLRGNHEDLMMQYVDDPSSKWANDPQFGGSKTLASYGDDKETLVHHLRWSKTLPTYIIIENFFITNGFGLPYYERRDEEAYQKALKNNRYSMKKKWSHEWEVYKEYPIINIHGHDYRRKGEAMEENIINLDTGCVYGKRLSAISLETLEIISVECDPRDREEYHEHYS